MAKAGQFSFTHYELSIATFSPTIGILFLHPLLMSKPVHIPDAMPELKATALLVICSSHDCRMMNAGARTIVEREVVISPEIQYTDRETQMRGPSGVISGVGDPHNEEDNRLKHFASMVMEHIVSGLKQGAEELYIAAPGKVLSILKDHLPQAHADKLKVVLEGNFLKEPALDILLRFLPDLALSAEHLHNEESYSTKKHLPK